MGMVLSSSPSSLMSRKEPDGFSAVFLDPFLAAALVVLAVGTEIVLTSGDVFSSSAFLGAPFVVAVFVVAGLSPGLIAGYGAARGVEVRRDAFGIFDTW